MQVFKVEKQDQMAQLAYQAGWGQSQPGAANPAQPLHFATLALAEAHLVAQSCDVSKALDNGQFKTYQSHLGNFILTTIEVLEA